LRDRKGKKKRPSCPKTMVLLTASEGAAQLGQRKGLANAGISNKGDDLKRGI